MVFRLININDLDKEMVRKYYPLLTPQRQKKIEELAEPAERASLFCAEIAARQCLSELLNASEFTFKLLCNINEKSAVVNFDANFYIVSCGEYIACAADKNPVGICMRKIEPFSFYNAQNILSAAEIRDVYSKSVYPFSDLVNMPECKESQPMLKYAGIYTLKSAYYTASGREIRGNMKSAEFSNSGGTYKCSDSAYETVYTDWNLQQEYALSIIRRK